MGYVGYFKVMTVARLRELLATLDDELVLHPNEVSLNLEVLTENKGDGYKYTSIGQIDFLDAEYQEWGERKGSDRN